MSTEEMGALSQRLGHPENLETMTLQAIGQHATAIIQDAREAIETVLDDKWKGIAQLIGFRVPIPIREIGLEDTRLTRLSELIGKEKEKTETMTVQAYGKKVIEDKVIEIDENCLGIIDGSSSDTFPDAIQTLQRDQEIIDRIVQALSHLESMKPDSVSPSEEETKKKQQVRKRMDKEVEEYRKINPLLVELLSGTNEAKEEPDSSLKSMLEKVRALAQSLIEAMSVLTLKDPRITPLNNATPLMPTSPTGNSRYSIFPEGNKATALTIKPGQHHTCLERTRHPDIIIGISWSSFSKQELAFLEMLFQGSVGNDSLPTDESGQLVVALGSVLPKGSLSQVLGQPKKIQWRLKTGKVRVFLTLLATRAGIVIEVRVEDSRLAQLDHRDSPELRALGGQEQEQKQSELAQVDDSYFSPRSYNGLQKLSESNLTRKMGQIGDADARPLDLVVGFLKLLYGNTPTKTNSVLNVKLEANTPGQRLLLGKPLFEHQRRMKFNVRLGNLGRMPNSLDGKIRVFLDRYVEKTGEVNIYDREAIKAMTQSFKNLYPRDPEIRGMDDDKLI